MSESDAQSQALAQLEARYLGVIEGAVDGIVIIDEYGVVETFNPAAEAIFGYRADEVVGRKVNMLMPEPDSTRHDRYLTNYLGGGAPQIIGIGRVVEGLRRNGEVFPMELAVGEVARLNPRRFVGTVRDITRRRALESTLHRREQELSLLLDNAPIGIFSAGLDGRFMQANPALCRLLGYPEQELLGRSCADVTVPEQQPMLSASLSELGSGHKRDCRCELGWLRRDGKLVEVSLYAVLAASDRAVIIGQVLDRSEQLRSERRSREAGARLAQVGRVSTLGEMASAIAHEINQPLAAISAYAQACTRLLEQPGHDLDVIRKTLGSISAQALRAGDIVRRIRGFVANRESARVNCDLNTIVETVLEFDDFDLRSNAIEVDFEAAATLPPVLADPIQVQQVCLNLIRNAVDAMRDLPATARKLYLSTRMVNGTVRFECADSGPGVATDMRARLFQPFQTTKRDGMGMGLSISRSIVEAHDGSLEYHDQAGGGACFVMDLPSTLENA